MVIGELRGWRDDGDDVDQHPAWIGGDEVALADRLAEAGCRPASKIG
jgi:hypothetical protein